MERVFFFIEQNKSLQLIFAHLWKDVDSSDSEKSDRNYPKKLLFHHF